MEIVGLPEVARDMVPLLAIGPAEQAPTHGDFTHYISLVVTWTGRDNGPLFDNWDPASPNDNYSRFIQPFKDIAAPAIISLDSPVPLNLLM